MENEFFEKDINPCDDCEYPCDGWEARYCCELCRVDYGEDTPCDDCDPWEI